MADIHTVTKKKLKKNYMGHNQRKYEFGQKNKRLNMNSNETKFELLGGIRY
jgi:hypothetical protein